MQLIISLVIFVFLALAVGVVLFNIVYFVLCAQRRRAGTPHMSLIPIVAQLFVFVAAVVSSRANLQVPGWVFFSVALSDPSLWQLLFRPLFSLLCGGRAQT